MREWIIVKVGNYYMLRLKYKIDGEWFFFKDHASKSRPYPYVYVVGFKWLAKRRLSELLKEEQENFNAIKELKEGGVVL